jgi:hypothetical protein
MGQRDRPDSGGAIGSRAKHSHRDLFLSQYHRLYLDGVLIPVVDLINDRPSPDPTPKTCERNRIFSHQAGPPWRDLRQRGASETLQAINPMNWNNFEEYRRLNGEPSLTDEPTCAPVLGYWALLTTNSLSVRPLNAAARSNSAKPCGRPRR